MSQFAHQLVRESVGYLQHGVWQFLFKPALQFIAQRVKMLLHVRRCSRECDVMFRDNFRQNRQVIFCWSGRLMRCLDSGDICARAPDQRIGLQQDFPGAVVSHWTRSRSKYRRS